VVTKLSNKILTAETALIVFNETFDEFFDRQLVHIFGSITDSLQQADQRGGSSGSTGYGIEPPEFTHFPGLERAYQWSNYVPWHQVTKDEVGDLFFHLFRNTDLFRVWVNRVTGGGALGVPSGPYPGPYIPDSFQAFLTANLLDNTLSQSKKRAKGRFVTLKGFVDREYRRFPPRGWEAEAP
jgi:hypothetical protein